MQSEPYKNPMSGNWGAIGGSHGDAMVILRDLHYKMSKEEPVEGQEVSTELSKLRAMEIPYNFDFPPSLLYLFPCPPLARSASPPMCTFLSSSFQFLRPWMAL